MLMPASFLLLAAAVSAPGAGEVKLPLREYLALVERAEAQDAAREKARGQVEPPLAAIVSQRVSLSLRDGDVEVSTTYEIEVRGAVSKPVPLPLTGVARRVTVDPPGPAGVRSATGGLEFVAPAAGRYRVQVGGQMSLEHGPGGERVRLAPMTAPVAEVEVSLPAERAWRCADAVLAEDTIEAGRRHLRLAVPRGTPATLELRRELRPQEPTQALAAAVSLTLVRLGREGVRRHDVVLYEVQRGEIGTMALTLPAGLEPDVVMTDEGKALPWLEGRAMRVERSKKLTGSGYLAIASRPAASDAIALEPLRPEVKVRARYLAYASDIAATAAPEPEASWTRVDVTDLPAPVQEVAQALGIVAAWRSRQEDSGRLRVAALPGAAMLDAVVKERSTTTLLTVENSLLHRDRFTVDGEGSSLEIALPENATVWSAQVGDVPVRPIVQPGRVLIPVGLASSLARTVELVVVQERSVPPGRSTLELALPEVRLPVLRHEWRLLLPERNRYRYAGGALLPARSAAALEPPPGAIGRRADARAIRLSASGTGEVFGRVSDETGGLIPGAQVRLTENATGRSLALDTDSAGEFRFASLASGTYSLHAELAGFQVLSYPAVRVYSGQTRSFALTLRVASMTETVSVAAEPEALKPSQAAKRSAEKLEDRQVTGYRNEVDSLKQGLVGGVKPVPVKIPESGKVLILAGALPPAHVSVSLEVKSPKD